MKNRVLRILNELLDERAKAKLAPKHIILPLLSNRCGLEGINPMDVRSSLNELYRENKIGTTETLNHTAIYVKVQEMQ